MLIKTSTVAAALSVTVLLALTGCSSDDQEDSDSEGSSAGAPSGDRVGPWVVTDKLESSLAWQYDLTNVSDVEQTTYVDIKYLDEGKNVLRIGQCVVTNATDDEFVQPGDSTTIGCAPMDQSGYGLPDFDHITLEPRPGTPTTQAERDEQGY